LPCEGFGDVGDIGDDHSMSSAELGLHAAGGSQIA
jgi:hypothetical protein